MIILPPTIVPRSRPELASFVIDTIEAAGVSVPDSSRLWRMHRLYNSGLTTIEQSHPDYEMALEAERDLQLLAFVFDQCGATALSEGYLERLRLLVGDSVLPQDDPINSPGRDAGFELYAGAICSAAQFLPVIWEEPDVTCVLNGVKYGFPAKRIKSLRSLEQRIRDAVRQIRRSGLPGVIVLDVGVAFNPSNYRLAEMADTIFWNEYYTNCRATWDQYEARIQARLSRANVLGLIIHDYHIRLRNGQWALAGMTMPVAAAARSVEDRRLFSELAYLYTHALPNQDDIENLPIALPGTWMRD
jgi:hypothetical protein